MQRDWDLIRKILLKLEEKADAQSFLSDDEFRGYHSEMVSYHFKLLHSAGLIEAVDYSSARELCFGARSLTWDGHEFLDKIRNDSTWNSLKTLIKSKRLELSFEVIKMAASGLVAQVLK